MFRVVIPGLSHPVLLISLQEFPHDRRLVLALVLAGTSFHGLTLLRRHDDVYWSRSICQLVPTQDPGTTGYDWSREQSQVVTVDRTIGR